VLVDYRPSWGRTLSQIGRPLLWSFLLSCAVTVAHFFKVVIHAFILPDLSLSLFGSALALLIGFRTNSAYLRWWEARTLWGGIVNQSRTWARQVLTYPDPSAPRQFAIYAIQLQIAFAYSLRNQLRNGEPEPPFPEPIADRLRGKQNVPLAILQLMAEHAAALLHSGHIGENRFVSLQVTVTELTSMQGGCERIRNTPLPRQYDYWPEVFVYLYCLLLPFAIVNELGWLTPLMALIVAFVFLVLNQIGRNLEDPFHSIVYGTPMTSLCRTIENNLRESLGEEPLPAIEPSGGVLE